MKRNILVGAALLAAASMFYASSQQFNPRDSVSATSASTEDVPLAQTGEQRLDPNTYEIPFLLVNRDTWEVFDPFNRGLNLESENMFEKRWERYKELLAFEYPFDYEKRFPRTETEQQAIEAAIELFKQPIPLNTYLKQPRSPVEQQMLEDAVRVGPE